MLSCGRANINTHITTGVTMYIVYKLTNTINNKVYFGYTGATLNVRFSGHRTEPRNTIISRSIRKYGSENFKKEIICECEAQLDAKFIARATKILKFRNRSGIDKCLMGVIKSSGGYSWKRY